MNNEKEKLPDLEEIIALMPGNIYWKDREGIYRGCNDNAAKLVQLKSRKDIIGKTLHEIAPKSVADEVARIDEEIMRIGDEFCTEEVAFNLDGKEAVYHTRKVPLKNLFGKVIGLVGISIDITERKEHEKALKLAKEKAIKANKAKSELIMNMSHDIRTPFSGILSLTRYLLQKETNPEKKDILTSVVETATNLLDILTEVMHLASLENETDQQVTHFDLKAIVTDIYKIMLSKTKQKGLALILTIDPMLPQTFAGNEYAIKRILLNLVGNAIKFTNTGKVGITILLKETAGDECLIEMQVSDTGIGIPQDKQNQIFEQFNKLDTSSKERHSEAGLGLGLWFVRQLVFKINGKIELESAPSQGSTFICTFPITKA